MRNLVFCSALALGGVACDDSAPEPSPGAAQTTGVAQGAKTQVVPRTVTEPTSAERKQGPKLPEEPREERPVTEMSDKELEVACFEGRREACDLLGH